MGRLLKAWIEEHQKDTNSTQNINSQESSTPPKKKSLTIYNNSALTDHATTQNLIINWDEAKIVDWESHIDARFKKGLFD